MFLWDQPLDVDQLYTSAGIYVRRFDESSHACAKTKAAYLLLETAYLVLAYFEEGFNVRMITTENLVQNRLFPKSGKLARLYDLCGCVY